MFVVVTVIIVNKPGSLFLFSNADDELNIVLKTSAILIAFKTDQTQHSSQIESHQQLA